MTGRLDDLHRQLVGLADGLAGLQAAAGQRDAEALAVMAAAAAAVELRRAAELGGDDDQRLVEQLASLRDRATSAARALSSSWISSVLLVDAFVVDVPAGAVEEVQVVRDLDEPHARLDQPAGEQAALAELAAVALRRLGRLFGRAGRCA